MSNVPLTELDNIKAGLDFIGQRLEEEDLQFDSDSKNRMRGAGYLCQLLSKELHELVEKADNGDMTEEEKEEEPQNQVDEN